VSLVVSRFSGLQALGKPLKRLTTNLWVALGRLTSRR